MGAGFRFWVGKNAADDQAPTGGNSAPAGCRRGLHAHHLLFSFLCRSPAATDDVAFSSAVNGEPGGQGAGTARLDSKHQHSSPRPGWVLAPTHPHTLGCCPGMHIDFGKERRSRRRVRCSKRSRRRRWRS